MMGISVGASIRTDEFPGVLRTMAIRHQKWDTQVGDVTALSPFPVVLTRPTWLALAELATALAREIDLVERELMSRVDLHSRLGLPGALLRAFRRSSTEAPSPTAARIMRFDFHPTTEGWRVSEVNSDVPGGFTESSRFADLVALHTGAGDVPGDAAAAWTAAIGRVAETEGAVALLSAPGWVEDLQVVAHLAARLREKDIPAFVASPGQLRWADGRARLQTGERTVPLGVVLRFYQAEWIARLRCRAAWTPLFFGGRTAVSNPPCAALSESKRLPLLSSELGSPMPVWRNVAPETRDPRDATRLSSGDWVLKPAFGNAGDDVAMRGATSPARWRERVVAALLRPRRWVAQRRFQSTPLESPRGQVHACIGVYVVDGRAAGAYGRLSPSRIIDHTAIDTAVLVES